MKWKVKRANFLMMILVVFMCIAAVQRYDRYENIKQQKDLHARLESMINLKSLNHNLAKIPPESEPEERFTAPAA